ncbi:MAG: prepilin peptidase [Patescibacteria group bacterium]
MMLTGLIFSFLFGIAVGSFLNVLVDRSVREASVFGRSYCESCGTPLPWYDLVPVLSFFILKGKCRYCDKKISWRLPLVEFLAGSGFLFVYWYFFYYPGLLNTYSLPVALLLLSYYLVVFSLCVVLFFTDLEYGLLPNSLTFSLAGFVFFFQLIFYLFALPYPIDGTLLLRLLCGFCFAAFFALLFKLSGGKAMGGGDAKLAFSIGLVLGWPLTLVSALLSFLFGGLISVILVLVGYKNLKDTIVFGPFLISSFLAVLFFGNLFSSLFSRWLAFF